MPSVRVKLNKATRIDGKHTPAGSVVEVDGRDPSTFRLRGDALYLTGRGIADLVPDDDDADAGNGKSKSKSAKG
ncbi:MAG: hypothetical protein DCC71_02960 [Proteobacteria bacterium]|nr:MAG: hypothetical protein DCC71_02960 [Pseudomonadota bacterium]